MGRGERSLRAAAPMLCFSRPRRRTRRARWWGRCTARGWRPRGRRWRRGPRGPCWRRAARPFAPPLSPATKPHRPHASLQLSCVLRHCAASQTTAAVKTQQRLCALAAAPRRRCPRCCRTAGRASRGAAGGRRSRRRARSGEGVGGGEGEGRRGGGVAGGTSRRQQTLLFWAAALPRCRTTSWVLRAPNSSRESTLCAL